MNIPSYFERASERAVDLVNAARESQKFAYAPYSNFRVGAAVLVDDGRIFTGCNVENSSFGMTVCAEQVAMFKAVSCGALDIVAVAFVTPTTTLSSPCGACRQVIAEFSRIDNPTTIIFACVTDETRIVTINELFPNAFALL